MSTTHVDISEVVSDHFANTNTLPDEVFKMSADQLEELIDACSEGESELVLALTTLLQSVKMSEGCFS